MPGREEPAARRGLLGWRNNGVCEDGEWFLREARSIRGHVGACGIEIVCAGVTIDRRRDHKRLAEERRRRGPKKKPGRGGGRASFSEPDRRAPVFFWGRRGLRSDPAPAGVIINPS